MTAAQPTQPQATTPTYWQAQPTSGPDYQIISRLRVRLVGLVAALVVQATIALLGVLPELPVQPDVAEGAYYYNQPASFWIRFAVIELIAAVVVSLAFGPGVRFGNIPVLGRLVLVFGFVAAPAAAIVLGAIDAAQAAATGGHAAAASSWLTAGFFATVFFGLPMIALVSQSSRGASRAVSL